MAQLWSGCAKRNWAVQRGEGNAGVLSKPVRAQKPLQDEAKALQTSCSVPAVGRVQSSKLIRVSAADHWDESTRTAGADSPATRPSTGHTCTFTQPFPATLR